MDWTSLICLAFALCFDSVAVSAIVGMYSCQHRQGNPFLRLLRFCLILGFMQGLMPFVGWSVAWNFRFLIEKWDHWIAFSLLLIIGIKMICDAVKNGGDENATGMHFMEYTSLSQSALFGIATSIDALIVGVSMALLELKFTDGGQLENMVIGSIVIAFITSFCCSVGIMLGRVGGKGIGNKSNIIGGIILILIGVKILFEHL